MLEAKQDRPNRKLILETETVRNLTDRSHASAGPLSEKCPAPPTHGQTCQDKAPTTHGQTCQEHH